MIVKNGIAVSPGVAIGQAIVLDTEGFRIARRLVAPDQVELELRRLELAIRKAAQEAEEHAKLIAKRLGKDYGGIFVAHARLIQDPKLRRDIEQLVRERQLTPEFATKTVIEKYARIFEEAGGPTAERASDIRDVGRRILHHLCGVKRSKLSQLSSPAIVLAPDLTPTETSHLDTAHVRAFATESGGRTSHTAIVAGALEIPAVVGIGPFLAEVADGQTIIVDGDHGTLIIDPDAETLASYERAEEQRRKFEADLARLKDLPAETRDGVRISLMGNIEFPTEVEHCLARGAEGVGLYRTEFLYLAGDHPPSEEEHFEAYRHVVEAMHGRPVVIRTLDLGADKLLQFPEHERERNPFLGQRSIRLCLQYKDIFRTQLRAILRVSVYGDVRIMFPLISTVHEFRVAKLMVNEVLEDLAEEGISFDRSIPVGMMVEVPSAAILADRFCPVTDFFSIGTNDLTQYTLAVDRNNQRVASLFSPVDPAVLRLLRMSIRAAGRRNVPVSVCGEMCADPAYAVLLIGLGVRNMSVTPHGIPEVKKAIRSITVKEAERYARRALSLETADQVDRYLRAQLRELLQYGS